MVWCWSNNCYYKVSIFSIVKLGDPKRVIWVHTQSKCYYAFRTTFWNGLYNKKRRYILFKYAAFSALRATLVDIRNYWRLKDIGI